MAKKNAIKVVVEIRGGTVQAIHASRGNVEVLVVDHDEYEAMGLTSAQGEKAAKAARKGLKPVNSWRMDRPE